MAGKISLVKRTYRNILRILPTRIAVYVIYFRGYKRLLNLKNPRFFGEKIQWLKVYGNMEVLSKYVDKYEVRRYVEEVCGEKYLIKLLGVYEDVNSIDFADLPNQFVIKCTNGCGQNIICRNKDKIDSIKTKREMSRWLVNDYSKEKKEMQYKNVMNRIIIEEFLPGDVSGLIDYKFYCFNGKARYYAIASNRNVDLTYDYYSMDGKWLNDVHAANMKNGGNIQLSQLVKEEMVDIVEKLAMPFQFVRVDLYYVNEQIKFGELTFTDGAGSDPFHPKWFDLEMAKDIQLVKYSGKKDETSGGIYENV